MVSVISRRAFLGATASLGLGALGAPLMGSQARAQARPFIVDAHCHIFSVLDLPLDGFLLAVAHGKGAPVFVTDQLQGITRKLHRDLVDLALERERLPGRDDDETTQRTKIEAWLRSDADLIERALSAVDLPALASALEVATRTRTRIAAEMIELYPEVSLFLPALVDYEHWTARHRSSAPRVPQVPLPAQIDAHAEVFRKNNQKKGTPHWIHGYAPFNPLRWVRHKQGKDKVDPLEQIRRAIGIGDEHGAGLGFIGVKLYPPTGFVPLGNEQIAEFEADDLGEDLDDAMRALFELCEEHDVPIISHASDGNAFAPEYERRGSPWGWLRALKEFPKLRLDLAHFGHDHGVETDGSAIDCVTWSEFIAGKLMPAFPNVYADLGYSPLAYDKAYRERYGAYVAKHMLAGRQDRWSAQRVMRERLMFGTDWWMLHQEPGHASFLKELRDVIGGYAAKWDDARIPSRFLGGNALRFLGVLDADGQIDRGNAAHKRLVRYYGRAVPAWLSAPPPFA